MAEFNNQNLMKDVEVVEDIEDLQDDNRIDDLKQSNYLIQRKLEQNHDNLSHDSRSLERDTDANAMDILNEPSPEIINMNRHYPTENKLNPQSMYITDDMSRDPMKFNEIDDEVLLTQKKDLEDSQAIYTPLIEPKLVVT